MKNLKIHYIFAKNEVKKYNNLSQRNEVRLIYLKKGSVVLAFCVGFLGYSLAKRFFSKMSSQKIWQINMAQYIGS